jgi:hypothetical protein
VPTVRAALGQSATLTAQQSADATVWQSSVPAGELVALGPAAAQAALAGKVPTEAPARVLDAAPGAAEDTLGPGSVGRLLVLDEPAANGWHASLDGKPLTARIAYGWAQAFEVGAGGGRLRIGFRSGSRHLWLVGELVVVTVAALSILPVRRNDDQEQIA